MKYKEKMLVWHRRSSKDSHFLASIKRDMKKLELSKGLSGTTFNVLHTLGVM